MHDRYLKPPNPVTMEATDEVRSRVADMLREIELGGPDAVRRYSRELDGWDAESFVVSDEEFERVSEELDDRLREHIHFAQDQVRRFAQAQRDTLTDLRVEMAPGTVLGHRHIPVTAVGAYVPGGRYPMLASSFMTVCVAKVAGVEHVVACAPPQRDGGIHPAMLYAMKTSGADTVLCLGGVQALAAMAFGLIDDVPPVDMLVGAGNAYVAEAKRQLFGRVGIDLLAGPTEILVIADDSADPRLVAADLLGQAEHGPTSPAGLIAIGEDVGRAVHAEVDDLLRTWPTAEVAGAAWRDRGWMAVAADDEEAIAIADEAANEHLEVQVAPDKLDDVPRAAAQLRLAVPGRGGDRRLRRQGGGDQPRPADVAWRALHGRAVGRQVPQDVHLPGADRGGHPPRRPCRGVDLRGRELRRSRADGDDAPRARRNPITMSDRWSLTGRVAIVIGAGRGLGEGCARALAQAGARVLLVARTAERGARRWRATSMGKPHVADVTDATQVDGIIAAAAALGDVGVLVNAAGTNRTGPAADYAISDWDALFDVNVRGTFLACQAFGGALLARGVPGSIVNLSSQMGTVGYPGRVAYCATKHAVEGMTKALGVEWARQGIRVNAVAPTFVLTPMTRPMLEDETFAAEVKDGCPPGSWPPCSRSPTPCATWRATPQAA